MSITETDARDIATRVMYELLGRRWVWPAITTTERVEISSGQNWISLDGRPVISIASVTLRGANSDSTIVDYVLENRYRLRLAQASPSRLLSRACSTSRPTYDITYTYGSPPPFEVESAIEVLTKEIYLAYDNPDECSLPSLVTSVSRQGISMQTINAQELLDKGRVGLDQVDYALSRFNWTGTRRRARVYSVNKPPPRRRNTTQATGESGS